MEFRRVLFRSRPRTVMQKAAYDFDALFAQKPKPRIRPTKVEFVGMPGADLFPKDRIANCFDAQLDDPVTVAGALVMSSFGNLVSPNIAYAGEYRRTVGSGQSVSVRVKLGGRRIM